MSEESRKVSKTLDRIYIGKKPLTQYTSLAIVNLRNRDSISLIARGTLCGKAIFVAKSIEKFIPIKKIEAEIDLETVESRLVPVIKLTLFRD